MASSPSPARAQDCTIQGSVAIFMVYQEENPDSVFYSEDGCLAGGGRGSGCCPGAQCRVCEPNAVESTSGKQMRWNSCLCEPCPPGARSTAPVRTRAWSVPRDGTSARRARRSASSAPGHVQPHRRPRGGLLAVPARHVLPLRHPRLPPRHHQALPRHQHDVRRIVGRRQLRPVRRGHVPARTRRQERRRVSPVSRRHLLRQRRRGVHAVSRGDVPTARGRRRPRVVSSVPGGEMRRRAGVP